MIQSCSPTLINNTITQNRCTNTTTSAKGGGLLVYNNTGSFSGVNNIVYDNYATTNPEIFGTVNFNYSCSSVALMGTGNTSSNPQFMSSANDDFNLTAYSPCVDTGDPASPPDPDGSRADMGALYFDHLAPPPNLDVTLTPLNPPIVIPAQGGSFQYTASVVNHGPATPFYIWIKIRNLDLPPMPPVVGPSIINPPVNVTVSRLRTQTIPGTWQPGLYTYIGYANVTYTQPAIDSSAFTFTKSTTDDGGPFVWEASCTGEPFPYEVGETRFVVSEFKLNGAYPNPFNPTTAISYQLQASSHVSLKIYDAAGRLVATLVDGYRQAGTHQVTFDGSNFSLGDVPLHPERR